jgi:hypothetical protein
MSLMLSASPQYCQPEILQMLVDSIPDIPEPQPSELALDHLYHLIISLRAFFALGSTISSLRIGFFLV